MKTWTLVMMMVVMMLEGQGMIELKAPKEEECIEGEKKEIELQINLGWPKEYSFLKIGWKIEKEEKEHIVGAMFPESEGMKIEKKTEKSFRIKFKEIEIAPKKVFYVQKSETERYEFLLPCKEELKPVLEAIGYCEYEIKGLPETYKIIEVMHKGTGKKFEGKEGKYHLPVGTKVSVKYKDEKGEEKEEEIELMYDLGGKLKEQKKQMEGKIEKLEKQFEGKIEILAKQIKELSEWKEAREKEAREKERCGLPEEIKAEIDIDPSEQPYQINRKSLAKHRKISFDMVDKITGILIPAYQIWINGKPVSFDDAFLPGSYDLIVKFKEYKTVKKATTIPPDEGPYVENVPLKKLEKYEFSVKTNRMKIDGIEYTYEFYADADPIEEHHIQMEKGLGRIYYIIRAEKEVKNLKVFCGYFFTQREMDQIRLGIPMMNNIHIPRLIEHLEAKRKSSERGVREVLDIMETMLAKYDQRRMLKQCAPTEIDQLTQYIENLKTSDPNDRVHMKIIIEAVEKLKS